MSLGTVDVSREVSRLSSSFSAMHVTPIAVHETPALNGLLLLQHRRVVNASGKIIKKIAEYDCRLPQDAIGKIFALLNAPRTINRHPLHLMQLFYSWYTCLRMLTPCMRLVGDDLYRLIGYEKLEKDLLKLYSAEDGNVENFVPKEVLNDLKARCNLPLNAITLRIYVKDVREIHTSATHLQRGMIDFFGSDCCSHVKQEEDHSRFSFTTFTNGQRQVVHIVVTTAATYATTTGLAQIDITPGTMPYLYEFKQGYQWVVDVTYKLLRLNESANNLTGALIRHLREQESPVDGCSEVLVKENLAGANKKDALLALWFRLNDISSMQNVFLLANLVHESGQMELATCFFKEAASQVAPHAGFWYASFRLVQEENLSYHDLHVLLQVIGTLFAQAGVAGSCRVEYKCDLLQRLVFSPDREFSLVHPVDFGAALDRACMLFGYLAGKKVFQNWLGHFIPHHEVGQQSARFVGVVSKVGERIDALPPSSIEGYFSHILLGNHEALLRHFVPVMSQSEGLLQLFYVFFVKCALLSRGYPFPKSMENGGLSLENLEVTWSEFLLQTRDPAFRQIGLDLLCNISGHVENKKKWISHFLPIEPASARRLIKTVESEVTEQVMKGWLEEAPQAELLAFDLVQSERWIAVVVNVRPDSCLPLCQAMIDKDKARSERILDCIIQKLSHSDQRVVALLLQVSTLTENMATWYFEGIKEAKIVATSDQALFCRKLLRSYPALLTKDHVEFIAKVHGASAEALLDSSEKEVQEVGVALVSRSQNVSPRTLKKLWHNLRQMLPENFSPWNAAFIQCVKAIGEMFPQDTPELVPVLLHPEALQHVPRVIQRFLQELKATEFTHANRSHLRRLISECMVRPVPCSALILFVDAHQKFCLEPLQDLVKSELLQKLENDGSQEVVMWYLAKVREKFFTPRHAPISQVRLLLRAFGTCRSMLAGEFYEHVRNLANVKEAAFVRGEVEQAIPVDASEFLKLFGPFVQVKEKPAARTEPTPVEKIKSCIRFKKWSEALRLLLEHKGEKEDAALVCKEQATHPTSQLLKLIKKYEIFDLAIWQAILLACEKENIPALAGEAIIVLLALKTSVDTSVQLALWQEIIKRPQWLCQENVFVVFKELDYIQLVLREAPNHDEVNRAIYTLVEEFIIALGRSSKRNEYVACAHQNLEALARDPAEQYRLGLTLLSYSEPYADTADFIRDCKLFERLLGHLHTVITSLSEFVTGAVSQKKNATPTRSVRLERFYATCRAFFKMAHCRIAEMDAIAAFTSLIRKMSEISFIDHLLLETLACFPALEVREALAQPLKRKLAECFFGSWAQAPSKETLQTMRQLLKNLLEQGSAQTLKHIYHCCTAQKRVSNSQYQDLLQLLEGACGRYFEAVLTSNNVHDFSNALDVALVMRQSVPNRVDTILELILRIIERSGWDRVLREQVGEFCQQNFAQVTGEQYVCTESQVIGERLYESAFASPPESIGALVPFISKKNTGLLASEQQFLRLSQELIEKSIQKAGVCQESEAKARLLDVALEAIRVNIERYPLDTLLPTQLLKLTMACSRQDTLLYPLHCRIVFILLKKAFQKEIIKLTQPGLDMWLDHLGKTPQDLCMPADMNGFLELQQSIFSLSIRNGFSEHLLLACQHRLLSLQEVLSDAYLEQRESTLKELLRVWRDHPAILFNSKIKQSMEMLLCPNSQFFGCDMGALGMQHAKRCASMYLDTLSIMFSKQNSHLSKQSYARYLIEATMEAKKYHAFDGDEGNFVNYAMRLFDVIQVCDTGELVELCARCFLMPTLETETPERMKPLKQRLLPFIQKHDPKMQNGILNALRKEARDTP